MKTLDKYNRQKWQILFFSLRSIYPVSFVLMRAELEGYFHFKPIFFLENNIFIDFCLFYIISCCIFITTYYVVKTLRPNFLKHLFCVFWNFSIADIFWQQIYGRMSILIYRKLASKISKYCQFILQKPYVQ